MHCKDTILRTQNNWPYSKFIPNSGSFLKKRGVTGTLLVGELEIGGILPAEVEKLFGCFRLRFHLLFEGGAAHLHLAPHGRGAVGVHQRAAGQSLLGILEEQVELGGCARQHHGEPWIRNDDRFSSVGLVGRRNAFVLKGLSQQVGRSCRSPACWQ